ncbi:NACHT domain-containing NTPase [Vibrio splendidus]
MDPITTTLTTVALKKTVTHFTDKLLNTNWSDDSEESKSIIAQLGDDDVASRYVEKYVSKNLKIRTLHSAESDVYLDEIYTPLTLTTTSNNDEIIIDDKLTLNYSRVVNIIGIAGHGKSTILRKLFLEELKKQEKFPFFLELKRAVGVGIIGLLESTFEDIGINVESNETSKLLSSGKIILLLDGFDEVPYKNRNEILNEINRINSKFNCRIICTTRPDTEICNEVNIQNLRVKNLTLEQIQEIINKLDTKKENLELIELIKQNSDLRSTLICPIFVNLLYVCYMFAIHILTSFQKVPSSFIKSFI